MASSPGAVPDLEQVLQKIYGFTFRGKQEEVCNALVRDSRDVCVVWATGSGKSVCYQLPALALGKTAIVISPLISLMQDQVAGINARCNGTVSTYLGTAQTDANAESKAYDGSYRLVYATPEKAGSEGFLRGLANLRAIGRLAVVAVDEAHCISEWGVDFRPAYRQLSAIRQHVPDVPMIALTATATTQVREDVCRLLGLRQPLVSITSVDRPNLTLSVIRKRGGMSEDFRPLLAAFKAKKEATIIYVPTVADTHNVANFLQLQLKDDGVEIRTYNAQMNPAEREAAHLGFLSGRVDVIVATVAFGMGIDKPDVRRVVHYGPPKTMEEYFQQIGRAGRDGLKSSCYLLVAESDFVKYTDDFYMKDLSADAKRVRLESLDALRKFAESTTACRWQMLRSYFGDDGIKPGEMCGRCDNSRSAGRAVERDFCPQVRVLLEGLLALRGGSKTRLFDVLSGKDASSKAKEDVAAKRKALAKVTKENLEELIPSLVERGYIARELKSVDLSGGYSKNYENLALTATGTAFLTSPAATFLLPVPRAILDAEAKAAAATAKRVQELTENGVDVGQVPAEEIEANNGPVLNALRNWYSVINSLEKSGRHEQRERLLKMLDAVFAWRSRAAEALRVAPHSVLSEHLAKNICYSQRDGSAPVAADALVQLGVRTAWDKIEELVDILNSFKPEADKENTETLDEVLELPESFCAAKVWEHAEYKGRAGKPPAWEVTYNRFCAGASVSVIAASPESGRPVLAATIVKYILTALTHARPVPLARLRRDCGAPLSRADWDKVALAFAQAGADPRSKEFKLKDIARQIVGDSIDIEHMSKSEEQRSAEAEVYSKIEWFRHLKIAGFSENFVVASPAKRARTS